MRLLTSVLILLLVSLGVLADHEPDHRYEVQGYLLDSDRQPLLGVGISISSGNQIMGSASSGSDGFYYIKLHLHDSSIGRKLVLTTPDVSGTIIMTANVGDTTTRRLHFANFIGAELVEGELQGMGTPRWMYYAGAVLVVIVIAVAAAIGLKKRRKRHRRSAQKSTHGKRSGKRRQRHKR